MIVVSSADSDFASLLAEQMTAELKVSCKTLKPAEALPADVELVITTENGPKGSEIPVLVLAKKEAPFRLQDIFSRLAQMRQKPTSLVALGAYQFSPLTRSLSLGKRTADLTEKEARLLLAIAESSKGISKDELLKNIWGVSPDMNTHTLETHIYRLREKFRELGGEDVIAAIDSGYRLVL